LPITLSSTEPEGVLIWTFVLDLPWYFCE